MSNAGMTVNIKPSKKNCATKAQPGVEQRSPGKYYSFSENTWQMFEANTGKKGYR